LPDLLRIFDSLQPPAFDPGPGRFAVQPIPGFPHCSVGKDAGAAPVLLVEAQTRGPRAPLTPLALEHISVLHNADCRIQLPCGSAEIRRLSVVRCTGIDRVLHEYFLRALAPVAMSLPPQPTQQDVTEAINRLLELFRAAAQPPRKAVQGLWAVLLVLCSAPDPAHLIRCWHSLPEDRFDFADGALRLEVKAAAGPTRSHCFSLEQLHSPPGTLALIASILIERSAGGQNIADLVEEIRQRVHAPDLLIRLDSVVSQALGTEWRAALEIRFDRQLAETSLRFFAAADIPSVPPSLPPEVTDVRFRVNLTAHSRRLPERLRLKGDLFRAVLPS
jgi:hypothetical protein